MRTALKHLLISTSQLRRRLYQVGRAAKWRVLSPKSDRISQTLIEHFGPVVQAGPFAGMKCSKLTRHSSISTKLQGAYKAELHIALRVIESNQYSYVVDIGSAEGYYAIGLALCLSGANVHAYEINPIGRMQCRDMVRANDVADRLAVFDQLKSHSLDTLPTEANILVFCDCEGCELGLLDPLRVPRLRTCDILVEVHDFIDPKISSTLMKRFGQAHEIERIEPATHDPTDYPALDFLNIQEQHMALDEHRPSGQAWLFMRQYKN